MNKEYISFTREWIKTLLRWQKDNRISYVKHLKCYSEPHTCVVCDLFHELGNEYTFIIKDEHTSLVRLREGLNA